DAGGGEGEAWIRVRKEELHGQFVRTPQAQVDVGVELILAVMSWQNRRVVDAAAGCLRAGNHERSIWVPRVQQIESDRIDVRSIRRDRNPSEQSGLTTEDRPQRGWRTNVRNRRQSQGAHAARE